MSDTGRYRRAYPRLFRHPGFKKLPPLGQRLTCYVLYGPQSNRIGLFYFSVNTAAEDLDSTPESIRKALRELASTFGWSFDGLARVIFIPSWWRWNPPDHEKVLRGNVKDLHDVPPCGLTDKFVKNLAYLKPELHESFVEACRIATHGATASQYQKQEQEHVSETGTPALRAAPLRGSRRAGFEKNKNGNGRESDVPSRLATIARETLKLTNPNQPLEHLVDAFLDFARREGVNSCSRVDAVAAVNAALVERRVS